MAYPTSLDDAIAALVVLAPVLEQASLEATLRTEIDGYAATERTSGSSLKAAQIEEQVRRVLSRGRPSPSRIVNAILTA